MTVNKRTLGTEKEFQAVKYLVDKGYTIVERNFRTRMGEIDIIAMKDEYLVFVEVKYRSTSRYGNASEAVGINSHLSPYTPSFLIKKGPVGDGWKYSEDLLHHRYQNHDNY